MQPRFLYFDLGNVVLRFSHQRAAEQMARVASVPFEKVWQVVFEDGLEWQLERGNITREEFHARFCDAVGARPDLGALEHAASDIFDLNVSLVGLVGHLRATGHRLGIFSNTSISHWEHCTRKFHLLNCVFDVYALSFQMRAMKPEAAAYARAAELAGLPAGQIFFTDDRADNVSGALAAGWDAVQYESVSQLYAELRRRGVMLNY